MKEIREEKVFGVLMARRWRRRWNDGDVLGFWR